MKVKPIYKSEFVLVSEGWHLFRVVEPKIEDIPPEEQKEVKDGPKNDRNYIVKSAVEGGDEDGAELQEYFANHSKKDFGLARLAGLMIKTESFPVMEDVETDTMRGPNFETAFKMKLPKRLFGGRIKHIKSKEKREGSDEYSTFANIVEYATVKEYNDIIAAQRDKKKDTSSQAQSTNAPTQEKTSAKDPWAT